MALKTKNLSITQGSTFQHVVRWGAAPYVYAPITGITQAAPAVVTATGHGVLDGWQVAIVSVKGMGAINAQNTPPKDSDYVRATVVDANTLSLNDVNSALFKAYTSGGYVQYFTPVDLTGFTARMEVKDKVGGNVLVSSVSTTPAGSLVVDGTAVGTRVITGTGTTFLSTDVGRVILLGAVNATITAVASTTSVTVTTDGVLGGTSFVQGAWSIEPNLTVTVDSGAKTISLLMPATASAALSWKKGVYDLEAESSSGVVTSLLSGQITVIPEVTT